MLTRWSEVINEHQVPSLVLIFGLLLGTIYVFAVPPWQHYDEPTHFEHIWLIANRDGNPQAGDFDQDIRREVAASMLENDFFRNMDSSPNLLSTSNPIWIGISQTGNASPYYWLSALPLRLMGTADITLQLYVVRFISLSLYLVVILAAYGIAVELTPPSHPLRWLLPTSILLLPSFVDIMTAANDDVGAAAFFSLFLWIGIRLINKGFSWGRIIIFLLLGILCFYTKNTVIIAAGLIIIPVAFSLIRGRKRRFVWLAFGAGLLIMLIGLITWGDAAYWYRTNLPTGRTRQLNPDSPLGDYAIGVRQADNNLGLKIEQLIPAEAIQTLDTSKVTVGAWMWADQPTAARTPILEIRGQTFFDEVKVTTEPQFFSYTAKIKSSDVPAKISLSPVKSNVDEPTMVYYDGIILAAGAKEENLPPKFKDSGGVYGKWGGDEFTNLVRNPSGEAAWISLNQWVNRMLFNRFPGNPSLILGLLLDPEPIKFYYIAAIKALGQSFWAKFGWAHVVLIGYRPYTILGLITLIGCVGAVFSFWRKRRELDWGVVLFFGISLIAIWGAALIRGLPSTLNGRYLLPVSRYAYPAIIPTMLILNIGWLEITRWFNKYLRVPKRLLHAFLILFFLVLDTVAIWSIYQYYSV